MFFGTDFLCKCKPQPILRKISSGQYISIVQNRTPSASDTEILLESFSDEEDSCKKNDYNDNENNDVNDDIKNGSTGNEGCSIVNDEIASVNESLDNSKSPVNEAAEIRRLLRRKDELERKQRMQERYNERLQVSTQKRMFYANFYDDGMILKIHDFNFYFRKLR